MSKIRSVGMKVFKKLGRPYENTSIPMPLITPILGLIAKGWLAHLFFKEALSAVSISRDWSDEAPLEHESYRLEETDHEYY